MGGLRVSPVLHYSIDWYQKRVIVLVLRTVVVTVPLVCVDRQDEAMKATNRNVTTKLCLASHSISFAVDMATVNSFIGPPSSSAAYNHVMSSRYLDIAAHVPNIIRDEFVPVKNSELDLERRLMTSDLEEQHGFA